MTHFKVGKDGTKRYYNENNQLHRENGPAIEYANGGKEWYINNQRYREEGSAIEYADGDKYWYINGIKTTECCEDCPLDPNTNQCFYCSQPHSKSAAKQG